MSQKWRSDRVALRGLSQVNLTFPRFRSEFGRHATGASARLKGSPTKQIEFAKTARKDCSTLARSPLRGGNTSREPAGQALPARNMLFRGVASRSRRAVSMTASRLRPARRVDFTIMSRPISAAIASSPRAARATNSSSSSPVSSACRGGRRHPEGAASDRSRRDLWRDRRHQLCATLCVRHCARV